MRKVLIMAGIAFLAACNSEPKEEISSINPGKDSTAAVDVALPYTAGYSSKFEMGDPNHTAMILGLWKDWDNGNLANGKNNFADTVEMNFWSGESMRASRDSVISEGQKFRDNFTSVTSRVDAVMPLKSTDRDENWVGVWGTEVTTDKKGKVDSMHLHEVWRINKQGKADLVLQFSRKALPAKK